jgi:H+/Cl- antiporter ClcA
MTVLGAVAHAPLTMMVMAGAMTGGYGLLAPATVTIGVASVVSGDRAISTRQPSHGGPEACYAVLGRPARRQAETWEATIL